MDVGAQALSDYLLAAKYAHTVDEKRENWDQAVDRVEGMHLEFYGEKLDPIRPLVKKAFNSLSKQ